MLRIKRLIASGILMSASLFCVKAEVDPNFYVYLCFGQSNMEGNAAWETVDNQYVDSRFQMLATTDFDNPKRTMGEWYTAYCPIVSPMGKLGMADYFGRTMVAALPADVKVGVVAVAMGGSPIEMFDKYKYSSKLAQNPNEWWATLAKNYYGGNPYKRLVDMAKKAQETGVIKGILLHQGCSNNGDPNWPSMVKTIYNNMLTDLGLKAADVPLIVGETLQQNQGGACYAHNVVIAKMPETIPTSHIVYSNGCPGNGQDPWHFSAEGYRTMGKRYAYAMLKAMGHEVKQDAAYVMPENLEKFFTLTNVEDLEITIPVGVVQSLPLWGVFGDGHREDLTKEASFSSTDFLVSSIGRIKAFEAKRGTVSAVFTDFSGTTHTITLNVVSGDGGGESSIVAPREDGDNQKVYYDLCGRRVLRPSKGVYILNGKKTIVK